MHDGLHPVDDELLALEHLSPRRYSAAICCGASLRRRGITSSANRVRFFTVFQCGMSATCMTALMWLEPIHSAQWPSWLATFSGVPTAMKNDLLIRSKSKPPCILSAPAARILS